MDSPLLALSPLDGRYRDKVAALAPHLSEFGLIRCRLKIEIEWFKALAREGSLPQRPLVSEAKHAWLDRLVAEFSPGQAQEVKALEAKTNHDVKALEYWIKQRLAADTELSAASEFVHFACTSEDINNLAHALALRAARDEVLLPSLGRLVDAFVELAHRHAEVPMLARTHGQPATPTTLGNELANIAHRLRRGKERLTAIVFTGKLNGAVGNYNAHLAAYPQFDWEGLAKRVVESLGLEFNPYTIQIEPHDSLAEFFDALARTNTVLLDADRDIWGYISLGYFKQRLREGEVGSSTMPHKVNPIDFENSEGNVGIANALLRHLSEKLPVSRWQRDLTDSTVLRNVGVALGHSLLAYDSALKGLAKLAADPARMAADLEQSWEVLAEAIQTVMRRYGVVNPYEQLKALTRGKSNITKESLHAFIRDLPLPEEAKSSLLELTPRTYLGLAAKLAKSV